MLQVRFVDFELLMLRDYVNARRVRSATTPKSKCGGMAVSPRIERGTDL